MSFLMNCDNKKCGVLQEPLLDKDTNQVFCSECGEEMKTVTQFAKKSMLTMGQIKRVKRKQSAFPVICAECNKQSQPKLVGKVLVCPDCGAQHKHLSPPIAHAIREYLTSNPVSSKANHE